MRISSLAALSLLKRPPIIVIAGLGVALALHPQDLSKIFKRLRIFASLNKSDEIVKPVEDIVFKTVLKDNFSVFSDISLSNNTLGGLKNRLRYIYAWNLLLVYSSSGVLVGVYRLYRKKMKNFSNEEKAEFQALFTSLVILYVLFLWEVWPWLKLVSIFLTNFSSPRGEMAYNLAKRKIKIILKKYPYFLLLSPETFFK